MVVLRWLAIGIGSLFALAVAIVGWVLLRGWTQDHPAEWREFVWSAAGGVAVTILYNIFLEVRSIRRMMNDHRGIPRD